MTPIVAIPKPCHEDWNAMTPNDQGRHCASCCKTVVDFTTWRNEDILRYLKKHSGGKVCGRFTKAQASGVMPSLDISAEQIVQHVARSGMGWLQKVAAIVVLGLSVTFSSCFMGKQADPVGEPQADSSANARQQEDSTRAQVLGGIGAVMPGTKDTASCKTTTSVRKIQGVKPPPVMLQGEAMPVETMGKPVIPEEEPIMGAPPERPEQDSSAR